MYRAAAEAADIITVSSSSGSGSPSQEISAEEDRGQSGGTCQVALQARIADYFGRRDGGEGGEEPPPSIVKGNR